MALRLPNEIPEAPPAPPLNLPPPPPYRRPPSRRIPEPFIVPQPVSEELRQVIINLNNPEGERED